MEKETKKVLRKYDVMSNGRLVSFTADTWRFAIGETLDFWREDVRIASFTNWDFWAMRNESCEQCQEEEQEDEEIDFKACLDSFLNELKKQQARK